MNFAYITKYLHDTKKYTKITETSYLKSLSIVMKSLDTTDVLHAYNNIHTFYEKAKSKDPKYLLNIFRHLKSIYDNLPEESRSSIEVANYEQLKLYAKTEFYKDNASSIESIPDNVDDDLLTHRYDELENSLNDTNKKIVWLQDIVHILTKHQDLECSRELNAFLQKKA